MSPPLPVPVSSCPRFPRVSGDEPRRMAAQHDLVAFSPRERG